MAHLNKFQLIFIMTVLKERSTKEGDETSSNIAILPPGNKNVGNGPIGETRVLNKAGYAKFRNFLLYG